MERREESELEIINYFCCFCKTSGSSTGSGECAEQLKHCFWRHFCPRNIPLVMSRVACPYVISCHVLPRTEELNHLIFFIVCLFPTKSKHSTILWDCESEIFWCSYRSLNATVAQYKHCLFQANTRADLKIITTTSDNNGI